MTKLYLKFNSDHVRSRLFLLGPLQRLKYYNPALPISVIKRGTYPRLVLTFESEDENALKTIPPSTITPAWQQKRPGQLSQTERADTFDNLSKQQVEEELRQQSPHWTGAPGKSPKKQKSESSAQLDQRTRGAWSSLDEGHRLELLDRFDRVTIKSQPAADPADPSSTRPPKTTYQRKVVLALTGQHHLAIWDWFRKRAGTVTVRRSLEDYEAFGRMREFAKQSEIDRRRVKEGVDAMKREQADLKRARQEAEKLSTEAV